MPKIQTIHIAKIIPARVGEEEINPDNSGNNNSRNNKKGLTNCNRVLVE